MVDILMATYNGAKFIKRQIDSLFAQSYTNWRLLVQDDGSNDGTVELMKELCQKYPKQIYLITDNPHPKGAATNFFSLLPFAQSEYVFFCDQDDVWDRNKIEITLDVFAKREKEKGENFPLLVHTDLRVVDENLKEVASSFMAYQSLLSKGATLGQILCQNNITGCTMALNRALINKMWQGAVPQNMLMHDWWLGIGAAAFGEIAYLPQSTMAYCQHGRNEVGAQKSNVVANTAKALSHQETMRDKIRKTYVQAQGFSDFYGGILSGKSKAVIKDYGNIEKLKKATRVKKILFGPYKKQGFSRVVGQLIFC